MSTGALVYGITKIVPRQQVEASQHDVLMWTFIEAIAEMNRCAPRGDLHIHISVEAQGQKTTWECGCETYENGTWDPRDCTGATHGCGSGTKCTTSPADHSAYKKVSPLT
jgi:hypothetical protein